MTIKPFCTPGVEWQGRKKEFESRVLSIPAENGNVYPPPIPATGNVPFYSPSDSENPIGEVMNRGSKPLPDPEVILSDDVIRVIE